jgi:hypothetical protein
LLGQPLVAESKEWQSEYLNKKCNSFAQTFLNYCDKTKGNTINNCDFFKFKISVRDDHSQYSPRSARN